MGNEKNARRRARNSNGHRRKPALIEQAEKILIVTEDSKSSAYYFEKLRDEYKLKQAQVKVDPNSNPAPISVAEYAIAQAKSNNDDPYDHVYCVVDRDRHETYEQAKQLLESYKHDVTVFHFIYSIPCFEFWILLHYKYSSKPFNQKDRSPCDALIKEELSKCESSYSKNDKKYFASLIKDRIDDAVKNSKLVYQNYEKTGQDNPLTNIFILIDKFKELKNK